VAARARPVGINHVAIEVADVEAAVALYQQLAAFRLRGRAPGMAFLDLGDQFLALAEGDAGEPASARHFGLVVDDVAAVRAAARDAGLEEVPAMGTSFGFRDPWGNHVEVVAYADVQFDRTPAVRRALGIDGLAKSERAVDELREKGLTD
jgi:lactoylglutathione lyase